MVQRGVLLAANVCWCWRTTAGRISISPGSFDADGLPLNLRIQTSLWRTLLGVTSSGVSDHAKHISA